MDISARVASGRKRRRPTPGPGPDRRDPAPGEGARRDVENEIERRQGTSHDRAATLLADLRVVAEEGGTLPEFARRLDAIRIRHARKERFLERLRGL